MTEMLSVTECAAYLKVSAQQVRNWIKADLIPAMRVGKQFCVSSEDLARFIENEHFLIEPDDHPYKGSNTETMNALSFFSGALGLDLGMEHAGIQAKLLCEFEKHCRLTIESNRPDAALIGDIWNYSADEILAYAGLKRGEVDVIFGGPPCQAFSTAGNRKGFLDSRGNAFLRYVELVNDIKPEYFVIENVRGLLSASYPILSEISEMADVPCTGETAIKGGALYHALTLLRHAGYRVTFELYNSANFGSPQIRERVAIIGTLSETPVAHLCPTHSQNGELGLPPWKTFGEAVEGLDSNLCHALGIPAKRLKYYKLIGPGENWKALPDDLQREALGKSYYLGGGKTGFLRRLSFDKPAPTMVTNPTMPATDLMHPILDRALSVEEYKRVQGFPDSWIICGDMLEQYKQIGNAVPIALGEAIGKAIWAHKKGTQKEYDFRYSRYKNTDEASWEKEFLERLNAGFGNQVSQSQLELTL